MLGVRAVRCLASAGGVAVVAFACSSPQPMRFLTDEERATSATVAVGDPAPWPACTEWVRGAPQGEFQPGVVHVLDLWAPWCGPCLAAMPHLAELERLHGDDVTVLAVSIVGGTTSEEIRACVRERATSMPSTVAIDGDNVTTERYLVALREMAVPRAFIIDRAGRLAWFGHPTECDGPLGAIVAGTWDLAAARERFAARERDRQRTRAAADDYLDASGAKDDAAALAATEIVCSVPIDHVDGMSPPWWAWLTRVRLLTADGRTIEAVAVAREAADTAGIRDEAVPLAELARLIATASPGDASAFADRALAEIRRVESYRGADSWQAYLRDASRGAHGAALLDIAAADACTGRLSRAVELQREALDRWPRDASIRPTAADVEATLRRYEAALAADRQSAAS